jgi:DNA-binding NarL/FixJ family response regulator
MVLANRIESIATEKTKSTLSSYSAMNIIETRSTISPQVEEIIKSTVNDEYYVNIVAVVLTNIDFSDAFEKTVEDKMIAEQEKLKAEYEKETAIVNAVKELEVAKLAAFGMSNAQIAEKLHMSVSVVKQAIRVTSEKTGMSRREFAKIL